MIESVRLKRKYPKFNLSFLSFFFFKKTELSRELEWEREGTDEILVEEADS